jgi:hypothetical protein
MKRRNLMAIAALALSVVAGGGTMAGTAAAATTKPVTHAKAAAPLPELGVQFHGTWSMYWNGTTPNAMFFKHLDALAANKVQLVRVDVGWSSGQPTNTAPVIGTYYHQLIDRTIKEVRARGMKIFLTVHQSPAWARPGTGNDVKQFPTNPASIKPWLTFVSKTWGSKLTGIEVWNEPNLAEFTGVSDANARATKYVPLLKAAYSAINAGNASVPVIFGGPSQTDDVFIRACYAAGAHGSFDIMSVHPYQGNQTKAPESTDIQGKARMTNLPAVIAAMKQYGDSAKPIWWTEFGFSVHSNAGIPASNVWQFGVPTDAVAADYLVRTFKLAQREYPQVKVGVVYTAYKTPSGPNGHQFGFRMLDADGHVHAQLTALKAMRIAAGG